MFHRIRISLFALEGRYGINSASPLHTKSSKSVIPKAVLNARERDMPVKLEKDPFEMKKPQCVLCKYKVKVDYKNVRLLSQFVSRHTGNVYGRHISGLCERQQNLVLKAVFKARSSGLMPYYFKEPTYYGDPDLFNPDRPIRPHKY